MENDVLGWRLAFSLIRAFDLDPRGPSGRLANLALIVAPTTTVVLSQAGREFILRLFR
jgi:hypothetical protein